MKQTLKEMIEEEERKEKERQKEIDDYNNYWEFCMNLWYDMDSAGDR